MHGCQGCGGIEKQFKMGILGIGKAHSNRANETLRGKLVFSMQFIFSLNGSMVVFLFNISQGICQKILHSAVPHPEDKNIIKQIATGLVACPIASTSRSVPQYDEPNWGFTYQVTYYKRVPLHP